MKITHDETYQRYARIMVLHNEGMTFKEIQTTLGYSAPDAVRAAYRKAKEILSDKRFNPSAHAAITKNMRAFKPVKDIYVVTLIMDVDDRLLFATFDHKKAVSYKDKANRMISKYRTHFGYLLSKGSYEDNETYYEHLSKRFSQWSEARGVIISRVEVR